jgi:hypothetical protein
MMKRSLLVILFTLVVFSSTGEAQAPKATPCPGVSDITNCPNEGCGKGGDPELNKRKNIRSDDQTSTLRSIQWMKELPNPTEFTADNRNRDELVRLGEGQKITVVAYALDVRREHQETCNCELDAKKDTDNHIVLVDPELTHPTLVADEKDSFTVEFTPRVRLDHPNFTREKLGPLIDPEWDFLGHPNGKLLVRVTGLLMFDSEHFLRHHLTRFNNWEIHPILKLEYCAEGTCRADSDENWEDLDNE